MEVVGSIPTSPTNNVDGSSVGRTSGCGSESRGFEPLPSTHQKNSMKSIKQKEQIEGYKKHYDPDHPYCTNWPVNKEKEMVDRFDLEEQIQNVWQTKDDLDAVTERIMEDTVSDSMTSDQITNVLIGLSELHETRMWKLWQIFETMIRQKNSFLSEEHTLGDVLDKIVDDAGEIDRAGEE